jgi:hypothetical protein
MRAAYGNHLMRTAEPPNGQYEMRVRVCPTAQRDWPECCIVRLEAVARTTETADRRTAGALLGSKPRDIVQPAVSLNSTASSVFE